MNQAAIADRPKFSVGETVIIIDNHLHRPLTGKVTSVQREDGRIVYKVDVPRLFMIVVVEKHLQKTPRPPDSAQSQTNG